MNSTPTPSQSDHAVDAAARRTAAVAMLGAGAMIAHQVGGKATRDAFFLSNFEVTSLPTMLIVASALSMAMVLGTTRTLRRWGPARLVPTAFGASAGLLLAEWALAWTLPRVASVAFYLHIAAFGSVLISTFWSLVNECFANPRVARRYLGRVNAASTFGGLLGGVVAGFAGAKLSVTAMLPVLAGLHLACAVVTTRLRPWKVQFSLPGDPADTGAGEPPVATPPGEWDRMGPFQLLRRSAFLRGLGILVFLGTTAAALLDYVFKARATEHFADGDSLIQFFAVFYTAVAVLTFLVQAGFGRLAMQKLQLTGTLGLMPLVAGVGSLVAVFVPSLASLGLARGGESVLRSSLFRSSYEILFNPVPVSQKRTTKTLIDVGFDRAGDAAGGGIIKGLLLLGPELARSWILGLAALLSGLTLFLVPILHRLYIRALARSLRSRAVEIDLEDAEDETTRSALMQSISGFDVTGVVRLPDAEPERSVTGTGDGALPADEEGEEALDLPGTADNLLRAIAALRSRDPLKIRRTLRAHLVPEPELVPHLVSLMAWNEVAGEVMRSLRLAAPRCTGQLVDALLDPEEEFAIRRRLPRVLSAVATDRAVEGLRAGLEDKRFEVRYQCGLALSRIHLRNSDIPFSEAEVFATVRREVSVDKRVWESYRLIDKLDSDEQSEFVDEVLRDRASRSLEHVFTLLSLVLPRQPLKIAFRGLHTGDPALRGTALEYLELVLPREIRDSLWPFLESRETRGSASPDRDAVMERLLKSNESIEVELAELRRAGLKEPPPEDEPRA